MHELRLQCGMRKLLLISVAMGILSFGATQEGWQHTLRPLLPAPFEKLLFPWDIDVELRDVSACWPDEMVPFYGAGVTFWCFEFPGIDFRDLTHALPRVLDDAGHRSFRLDFVSSGNTYHYSPSFTRDELIVSYWVFRRTPEPDLVAFAVYREDSTLE